MNYSIRASESFDKGVRRIINQQVDEVVVGLMLEKDVHKAIHDARRGFKIIRSIYRLIRFEIGNKQYRRINAFYRDESKRLSFLRDLTAMIETLDMLYESYPSILTEETIHEATQMFEHQRLDNGLSEEKLVRLVAWTVQTFREEMNIYPKLIEKENIIQGLTNVYSRGYHAFYANYPNASAEVNHEWRKRTKYLRYQFHIVRNAWHRIFSGFEKELHSLTDLLGDYNNLVVLKSHLASPKKISENTRKLLWQIAGYHQNKLHKEAFILGQKLFWEHPRFFSSRMNNQIRLWWKEPMDVLQ